MTRAQFVVMMITGLIVLMLIVCCSRWQSSPDVFIPKDRSNDLEAISRVIQEARHFIYISIIDYLPLLSRNAHRLEPLHLCQS